MIRKDRVRFWRPAASVRTAAEFNHLPGRKQRCWAHLWRDIDALDTEYPDDTALAAWVAWAVAGGLLKAPVAVVAPWVAFVLVEATVYRSIARGLQQQAGPRQVLLAPKLIVRESS